jgi:hypothetical protein
MELNDDPGAIMISLGENPRLTPDGAPAEDRETAEEKPLNGLTVTVTESEPSCGMLIEFESTEMSKSGGAEEVTSKAKVIECD